MTPEGHHHFTPTASTAASTQEHAYQQQHQQAQAGGVDGGSFKFATNNLGHHTTNLLQHTPLIAADLSSSATTSSSSGGVLGAADGCAATTPITTGSSSSSAGGGIISGGGFSALSSGASQLQYSGEGQQGCGAAQHHHTVVTSNAVFDSSATSSSGGGGAPPAAVVEPLTRAAAAAAVDYAQPVGSSSNITNANNMSSRFTPARSRPGAAAAAAAAGRGGQQSPLPPLAPQPTPPTRTPPAAAAGGSSSSSSRSGGHAGLRAQAGALYRKNAVYQRRNLCSNICLLSAPIFFCVMLLAVQVAINRLLLTGDDYECGCQCTRCCYQGNTANCTSITSGTCPYDCLARNKSNCGVQFSSPLQSVFCAIPHTSAWPPILQTPAADDRAAPYKPKAALLFTGSNATSAAALSAGLLPEPSLNAGNLLSAQRYLERFTAEMGPGAAAVPGEFLSLLGFRMGTSSRIQAGLYLETALVGDGATLYALWPDGACERMGLQGKLNTSLTDMIGAVVNASNPAPVAAAINARLANLSSSLVAPAAAAAGVGGNGEAEMSQRVLSLKMNCTDVVLSPQGDVESLQRTLYCGYYQARCNGSTTTAQYAAAFDWRDTIASAFRPDLYYNDTYGLPRNEAPTVYQRVPQVLNLAVNSWLRNTLGPSYTAELIGVMETPKIATKVNLDFSALLGPLFFTWVIQMLLPIFLMQLVYEKERKLRMMMKMHGLGDTAYWLVMYSWFLLLYVAYMAIFVLFGSIIGLNMFRRNSYGIQAILYFIFGNNMIALAFLLSCFFTSSKTATVFAYLVVFGTGLIGSLLLSQLINAGQWYTTLLQLVPSFALFRGLFEMGEYAFLAVYRSSYGMSFGDLWAKGNGMLEAWLILGVEWVVFMVLAWYLEQVFASGTGNRRHPLFFLAVPRRFIGRCLGIDSWASDDTAVVVDSSDLAAITAANPLPAHKKQQAAAGGSSLLSPRRHQSSKDMQLPIRSPSPAGGVSASSNNSSMSPLMAPTPSKAAAGMLDASGHMLNSSSTLSPATAAAAVNTNSNHSSSSSSSNNNNQAVLVEPDDVAAERLRVEGLDEDEFDNHPIVVRRLNKTYPGQDGQPPKLAVRTLDLAIERGECFGLLGPNGAGKSTSINMMVGLLPPTAGTAFIGGRDITRDMSYIYSIMGVCPQHDLLWDTLTGREHLLFYGRLKGLTGPELQSAVESSLRAVNLWNNRVADKQARQYSGGMKRRLSVAISFMGDPLVVYLDEPSTGLDPASRRNLWDVVKSNKAGRAIVLTTHSMEEAEMLCDRLGIFVDGRLVCIGNPKDITRRYGGFLVFTITVPAEQESAARQLVLGMSPSARLTYSVGGTLKFELPTTEVSLSRVFASMAGTAASGLAVLDWGVANATLEEVFIRFARSMGLTVDR